MELMLYLNRLMPKMLHILSLTHLSFFGFCASDFVSSGSFGLEIFTK